MVISQQKNKKKEDVMAKFLCHDQHFQYEYFFTVKYGS